MNYPANREYRSVHKLFNFVGAANDATCVVIRNIINYSRFETGNHNIIFALLLPADNINIENRDTVYYVCLMLCAVIFKLAVHLRVERVCKIRTQVVHFLCLPGVLEFDIKI